MKKLIICGTVKDVALILKRLCLEYDGQTTVDDFIDSYNFYKDKDKEEVFLC